MLTGRLFRFRAVFALLDTQATAEGPPGYSGTFREPKVGYDAAGNRVEGRKERDVAVRCQVETGQYEAQVLTPFGADGNTSLTIVTRASFLREAGLLDDKNQCAIVPNARLRRVEKWSDGTLIDEYEKISKGGEILSGVFVKEVAPSDYGFTGDRDLWVIRLEDRANTTG